MLNLTVQNLITLQADGVEVPLCLEMAIYAWISKGCITTEESEDVIDSIAIDDRSNKLCQSSALWTFPLRRSARSTSPCWLKQNSGW